MKAALRSAGLPAKGWPPSKGTRNPAMTQTMTSAASVPRSRRRRNRAHSRPESRARAGAAAAAGPRSVDSGGRTPGGGAKDAGAPWPAWVDACKGVGRVREVGHRPAGAANGVSRGFGGSGRAACPRTAVSPAPARAAGPRAGGRAVRKN